LLTTVESDVQAKIDSGITALIKSEVSNISVSRNNLVSTVRRNLLLTIIIGTFGGMFLLGIAFVVIRRITHRLSTLLEWSRSASQGNWSNRLSADSKDEVGKLTMAMEDMRRNILSANKKLAASKTEAEQTAEALRIYANAFEKSGEPILITDKNNRIINANSAFTEQTGYSYDDVKGKNPKILASGKTPASTYDEMWQALNENGFWQGEFWDKTKSGRVFPKLISISAIKDENNEDLFFIASFNDITERKEAEERIAHLAHHDILTGLPNRFSLEDRLAQALSIANRDQTRVAVFFIDLDRFKNINDSLGHQVGDKLLIQVAERLKKGVRASDIVARIGGDEFVIVLTRISDSTQAAVIADTLLKEVSKPYSIDTHTLKTSPSIGISIYPDDSSNGDELMRNADIAMYHAKEHGRNNYHYFTNSMLLAAQERLQFQAELRSAMDQGHLELHYQPLIHASQEHVSSMEALIRWRHPERGEIQPNDFIPVAEDTGLIHELSEWIFDEACRQLSTWINLGSQNLKMSINLSARQLHFNELSDIVSNTLSKHHLKGQDLELEITETAAMVDPEVAVQQLNALRQLGVGLAIDDFGTGYSSLSYLKRLPIQVLKLDRTFVRDIEHDQNDLEISAATISLAHNLGLKVVAEGVETEAQVEFLIAHHCDYLQGYYFSRPLPAPEATKYLQNDHPYVFSNKSGERSNICV
ncbi:MAG: EAL domain-containing protein, partial [Gammaproteobacteria bacterium]|nr:EAL domain-containing protein [Gammaproteobacteria bacterium]